MTREVKLSLIFGFALVLVVGVLISDHLSGARRAKLQGLDPAADQGGAVVEERADRISPAQPTLVLVDPRGRPQPLVSAEAGPATIAGTTPGPDPLDVLPPGGSLVLVDPASTPSQTPIERLREQLADAMTDLGNGSAPPAAVNVAPESLTMSEDVATGLETSASPPTITQPTPVRVTSRPKTTEAAPRERAPVSRSADDAPFATYRVQEGDTLWSLSTKFLGDGRRHDEIVSINKDRLGPANTLRVGASIRIPSSSASGGRTSPVPGAREKPSATRKAPERTPVTALASASGSAGPGGAVAKKPPTKDPKAKASSRTYTVKSGDTLSQIAQKMLGSSQRYDDIIEANASTLGDEDTLEVGMVLTIPAR